MPWEKIVTPPAHLNKKVLEMKKNFNYYKWCGEEYEFLGDILEYLKMIDKDGSIINYGALREILMKAQIADHNNNEKYYKFSFIKEIRNEIKKNLCDNGDNTIKISEKLSKLLGGYQVNYKVLCDNLG